VARAGALTALSQTLLKVSSPGVPDFYQGTEVPCLTLVDPDNRRPVDFHGRRAMLDALRREAEEDPLDLARRVVDAPEDGRAKMLVPSRALAFRRAHRALFEDGQYVPLEARGDRARHAVAFARRSGGEAAIALAARFFLTLRLEAAVWDGTV